ncbi:MAG: hypothetical protein IPK83_19535 [Planctomycetes bacterium]|nr:hypothetical protein [Planctomycetota bacterium]
MNKVKISIIGLTVLALVVVVLQNTQATTVRAFGAEATMPMAFLLGLTGRRIRMRAVFRPASRSQIQTSKAVTLLVYAMRRL